MRAPDPPSGNSGPVDTTTNPYSSPPVIPDPTPDELGVETLTTAHCWSLIEASKLGRLAYVAADGTPTVIPINFLVHDRSLYLRSAPGEKLRSLKLNPLATLEVDGADDSFHWSVVVRATAHRLESDDEIEASGVLDLRTASQIGKYNYLRLVPTEVTGRRFPRRATPAFLAHGKLAEPVEADTDDDTDRPARRRVGKPLPIPHFEPRPH